MGIFPGIDRRGHRPREDVRDAAVDRDIISSHTRRKSDASFWEGKIWRESAIVIMRTPIESLTEDEFLRDLVRRLSMGLSDALETLDADFKSIH